VIVRGDLSSGYQGVQGMHAALQFAFENRDVFDDWHQTSDYLGFLSVANESELARVAEQAEERDIRFSVFREPDIDNQITAIALEPGTKSKKLCSQLPLALRGSK
jgi:peptidyl-tRNA hydrolase